MPVCNSDTPAYTGHHWSNRGESCNGFQVHGLLLQTASDCSARNFGTRRGRAAHKPACIRTFVAASVTSSKRTKVAVLKEAEPVAVTNYNFFSTSGHQVTDQLRSLPVASPLVHSGSCGKSTPSLLKPMMLLQASLPMHASGEQHCGKIPRSLHSMH